MMTETLFFWLIFTLFLCMNKRTRYFHYTYFHTFFLIIFSMQLQFLLLLSTQKFLYDRCLRFIIIICVFEFVFMYVNVNLVCIIFSVHSSHVAGVWSDECEKILQTLQRKVGKCFHADGMLSADNVSMYRF